MACQIGCQCVDYLTGAKDCEWLPSCERVFNIYVYANGVSLNMYHVFVLDTAFETMCSFLLGVERKACSHAST